MKVTSAFVTSAWLAGGLRDWHRFRAALPDPAGAQRRVLDEVLAGTGGTAYGRRHELPDRFEDLPPRSYDELEPWIARCAAGERRVLTAESIERFEPSSGSTAASKLVPSTPLLRAQFRRAIHAWVVDLYSRRRELLGGPAYWSISPLVRRPATPGGIPVGFEEDSAYLGGLARRLVNRALAVPGQVRQLQDVDRFLYATLLFLLAEPELRLISVWNPTFLTRLTDALDRWWDRLARDLYDGVELCGRRLRKRRRARALDQSKPWPRLGLISCWTDAHAATQLAPLEERFRGVPIQPKGLLATEAFVTIPFQGARVLAVTSHFFEFEVPDGRLLRAEELREGDEACVVVTTGGGLLRYRLGDRVAVTGRVGRTPALRFLGKVDRVSDLCGEKLSEAFVSRVLAELGVQGFSLLAPDGAGYTLYTSDPPRPGELERRLAGNPHYRWCVELGQLAPVRTFRVRGDAYEVWLRACLERGQRLGDIKPQALDTSPGWSRRFQGSYV